MVGCRAHSWSPAGFTLTSHCPKITASSPCGKQVVLRHFPSLVQKSNSRTVVLISSPTPPRCVSHLEHRSNTHTRCQRCSWSSSPHHCCPKEGHRNPKQHSPMKTNLSPSPDTLHNNSSVHLRWTALNFIPSRLINISLDNNTSLNRVHLTPSFYFELRVEINSTHKPPV